MSEPKGDLAGIYLANYPHEAAPLLEAAGPEAAATLLAEHPPETNAVVVGAMGSERAVDCLTAMSAPKRAAALGEMPPPRGASILRELEPNERNRWLDGLPPRKSAALRAALEHPEGSAGTLMEGDPLALPASLTGAEARDRLGRRVRRRGRGNYVYLIDGDGVLSGVVSQAEILAADDVPLAKIMHTPVASLRARDRAAAVLSHPGWRSFHALPVVDQHDVLVGVLRRESLEELRHEAASRAEPPRAGVGLDLAELYWSWNLALIDAFGRSARETSGPRSREETSDDR